MLKRIFLGYDSPFLPLLVQQLFREPASLAHSLVLVPTSQSGRMLRESLAASAGAVLAPTVLTPGALLKQIDTISAPAWVEKLAWSESLKNLTREDWESYTDLFPVCPLPEDESTDWTVSIATDLTDLHTVLLEKNHNFFSASKFLTHSPEAGRWENLASLEAFQEKKLTKWGYQSRSTTLKKGLVLPETYHSILLAGLSDIPKYLEEALEKFPGKVLVFIPAPEGEAEHFTSFGIPKESWAERELTKHAEVHIASDPLAQAQLALEKVMEKGDSSDQFCLGSADECTSAVLARTFTEHSWPAFHPGATRALPSIIRWLTAWKEWLTIANSRHLALLFTLPESATWILGHRQDILTKLNEIRNQQAAIEPALILSSFSQSNDLTTQQLCASISSLIKQREEFLAGNFHQSFSRHLHKIEFQNDSMEILSQIESFLVESGRLASEVKLNPIFWLQTLLNSLNSPALEPPTQRVIDVQGWLELLFEPGKHLVICGMNESIVPSRLANPTWLSENIRKSLNLTTDKLRGARDAFLLHAMLKMREKSGSASLICGKTGAGGEVLLPSRLLLRVSRDRLVPCVENLFQELAPPEADLIWSRDWKWHASEVKIPERIGVTSLGDYLACPFRFYLKHLLKMEQPDPDRREMNQREFGNITHLVLETWASQTEVNLQNSPQQIASALDTILDALVSKTFGGKPPLSTRIQTEQIRQRLHLFAQAQAESFNLGWEIIAVETKFTLPSNGLTISGKIDRLDQNRNTGQCRVIDYKTGKNKGVIAAHLQKITHRTLLPAHLTEGCPAFHSLMEKDKEQPLLWVNLQLPLYALAQFTHASHLPIPTYISLAGNDPNSLFLPWDDFSISDLNSAKACMDWITSQIQNSIFWPPSEKVRYDDYKSFIQNGSLSDAFQLTKKSLHSIESSTKPATSP